MVQVNDVKPGKKNFSQSRRDAKKIGSFSANLFFFLRAAPRNNSVPSQSRGDAERQKTNNAAESVFIFPILLSNARAFH